MNGSTLFICQVYSCLSYWGNNGCARHVFRENTMKFKTINVSVKAVQLPSSPSEFVPILGDMFEIEPYVCIQGEDRIYHRSEYNELVKHIEELNSAIQ